jgi:hypothetical protein
MAVEEDGKMSKYQFVAVHLTLFFICLFVSIWLTNRGGK